MSNLQQEKLMLEAINALHEIVVNDLDYAVLDSLYKTLIKTHKKEPGNLRAKICLEIVAAFKRLKNMHTDSYFQEWH